MSQMLIRYKEQLDYELRRLFLVPLKPFLVPFCRRRTVVCCPSSPENERRRGFRPLAEMLTAASLPFVEPLEKGEGSQKRASLAGRLRDQGIRLRDASSVQGRDVLLFDDVFTTGETFRQSLQALRAGRPRSVRGLILLDNRPV